MSERWEDTLVDQCTPKQIELIRAVWAAVEPYGRPPHLTRLDYDGRTEVCLDWSRDSVWASLTLRDDGSPTWILRMPGLARHRSSERPWDEQDQELPEHELCRVIKHLADTTP